VCNVKLQVGGGGLEAQISKGCRKCPQQHPAEMESYLRIRAVSVGWHAETCLWESFLVLGRLDLVMCSRCIGLGSHGTDSAFTGPRSTVEGWSNHGAGVSSQDLALFVEGGRGVSEKRKMLGVSVTSQIDFVDASSWPPVSRCQVERRRKQKPTVVS
jgi:hypothetical protein